MRKTVNSILQHCTKRSVVRRLLTPVFERQWQQDPKFKVTCYYRVGSLPGKLKTLSQKWGRDNWEMRVGFFFFSVNF